MTAARCDFLYVKRPFRDRTIAKQLLDTIERPEGDKKVFFTYQNQFAQRYGEVKNGAHYNPFLFWR